MPLVRAQRLLKAIKTGTTNNMKAGRGRSYMYLNNNPSGSVGIIGLGTE